MKKVKGFILISSLFLLLLFSYLSISTIQNQTYSSKIDKLKYFELQALIHIKYIKDQLLKNTPIEDIDINDTRYSINIVKYIQENSIKYDIYIKHKTEHISIYKTLSLK